MNCQDIARILDEQEVDRLLAAEQADVQAHIATCGDCARDWQIHAQLAAAAIPAVPAELRAFYAAQATGAVSASGRRRGGLFVVAALVAVAAAASMFIFRPTEPSAPVVAEAGSPPVGSSTMQASDQSSPAPATDEPAQVAELPVKNVAQATSVTAASHGRLTLVVLPARHESTDGKAKSPIEAFHSLLLQALRNSPDVVVEMATGAGAAAVQPVNRVMVVSPLATTLTSGQRMYRSGDGNGGWSGGSGKSPPWPVEVLVEPSSKSGANRTLITGGAFAFHLEVDNAGLPSGGSCGTSNLGIGSVSAGDFTAMGSVCSSPTQIAAALIRALRQKLEPPPTDTAQFTTRLKNSSISTMDRQRSLSELLTRAQRGGVALDAAAIDAIGSFVDELPPDQRAFTWRRLHGMRQPGLVSPLIKSLQQDDDEKVRLEALSTLLGDYSDDSRVRAALESVAREDGSRLVRMAAQRPLAGDAQWQRFVVEAIADKSLPASQRLAPATYGMRADTGPDAREKTMAALASADLTSELLDIFQKLRSEATPAAPGGFPGAQAFGGAQRSQEESMRSVVSLMTRTDPPAALDLQIKILSENLQSFPLLTNQALAALMGKRDDPRVSRVLDDIAAGKSGPELRNQLEQLVEIQRSVPPFGF